MKNSGLIKRIISSTQACIILLINGLWLGDTMNELIRKRILLDLSLAQNDIVSDIESNILVTACPGSGKTRTLTRKLAYVNSCFPESKEKIVAITYTNRAANEIRERLEYLQVETSNIWVGTIHQFCLEFILRKFGIVISRLSHGIKIIDEYITNKYLEEESEISGIKYNRYDKPILQLTTEGQLLEKNIEKRKLAIRYHKRLKVNKEIDFDLILTLALKILEEHPVSRQIIANSIRSIYVDEYQDTNEMQYQILGKLAGAKKEIKFMFVGDADQAIYSSLGGVSKTKDEIEEITQLSFRNKVLNGCYRSTQNIVDLYINFQESRYQIESLAENSKEHGTIYYDKITHKDNLGYEIAEIITKSLEGGVPEYEICVLAPTQFLLSPVANSLKAILPNVSFRSQEIYPIRPDDFNIFYKISILVFTEPGRKTRFRKKVAKEIIEMLQFDYNISIDQKFSGLDLLDFINSIKPISELGLACLEDVIERLFAIFSITREKFESLYALKSAFFEKIQDRLDNPRLSINPKIESFKNIYKEKEGINISTIHKVKGEEYEVVIAFGFLEEIIPHFKSKDKDSEARRLLYVTISRAKKSLYIFSERGRKNNGYPEKIPTILLDRAMSRQY